MKLSMQSTALKASAFALTLLMVTACNTVAGAGKDIEEGGEAVTDAAQEVESDIKD